MAENNCVCVVCKTGFHRKPSHLLRGNIKYCSLGCKYKDMRGCKMPISTRQKMSETHKVTPNNGRFRKGERRSPSTEFKKGPEHHMYIDGETSLLRLVRTCQEYHRWRTLVFQRDRWTCQTCGGRGVKIQAHHITRFITLFKSFLQTYPELDYTTDKEKLLELSKVYKEFWNVDNGVTLCDSCHKLTESYGCKKWQA